MLYCGDGARRWRDADRRRGRRRHAAAGAGAPRRAARRLRAVPAAHRARAHPLFRRAPRHQRRARCASAPRSCSSSSTCRLSPIAALAASRTASGRRWRSRAHCVHDPQNVLLDEPTNGLDVMSTRAVRAVVRRLRDEGRCRALLEPRDAGGVGALRRDRRASPPDTSWRTGRPTSCAQRPATRTSRTRSWRWPGRWSDHDDAGVVRSVRRWSCFARS